MEGPYHKKQSAIIFILKGLIPYSRENLLLAYKPNSFFNELEKISNYRQPTLRNAYWRGRKQDLIEENPSQIPHLTAKGLKKVKPFVAKRLGEKSRLIVIFDVPESIRSNRDKLRNLLKAWGFEQVQKSVWASDLDHREILIETIDELNLSDCVEVYEGLRLLPN